MLFAMDWNARTVLPLVLASVVAGGAAAAAVTPPPTLTAPMEAPTLTPPSVPQPEVFAPVRPSRVLSLPTMRAPVISVPPPVPAPPASVATYSGPGLVSGAAGFPRTIMIPGSAVPGTLFDNGNGTGTIMVPGAMPQVVPAPR